MTNTIYNTIADRLLEKVPTGRLNEDQTEETVQLIQWVDLHGNQGDVTDKENPIHYPACFLEWNMEEGISRRDHQETTGTLTVHLFVEDYSNSEKTPSNGEVKYNPLAVKHNVYALLQRFHGANFSSRMSRISERMNADYDALTEFEIDFYFTYCESYNFVGEAGELLTNTLRVPKPDPDFVKELKTGE